MITSAIRDKRHKELIFVGQGIGEVAQRVRCQLLELTLQTAVTSVVIEADAIRLQSDYVTLGWELRPQVEAILEQG